MSEDTKSLTKKEYNKLKVGDNESNEKEFKESLMSDEDDEISIYDLREMHFDKSKVNLTYFFLFYINMSLNYDHGTMPSATKDLQTHLDLNAK